MPSKRVPSKEIKAFEDTDEDGLDPDVLSNEKDVGLDMEPFRLELIFLSTKGILISMLY